MEKIAHICARVPAEPARTLSTRPCRLIWFTHIVLRNEGWGPGLSFGRVDQYLYPFLEKDLDRPAR